jgi:hypothetical protein
MKNTEGKDVSPHVDEEIIEQIRASALIVCLLFVFDAFFDAFVAIPTLMPFLFFLGRFDSFS